MEETRDRRALTVVAVVVIGGAALLGLVFSGGQVNKVLSTVGNAITTPNSGGNGIAGDGTAQPTPDPASGDVAEAGANIPTLLIVRTGELELAVADLAVAVREGDAAVERAGGYVSGSNRTGGADGTVAQATYRIPSSAWQSTLDALRALGTKVDRESVQTEEVTGQVVDLTSRIANLRTTEAALQAIMAKATKISDVLEVQGQLTTTRGEIEKLVGEKASLVDRASYGSLAITFRVPAPPAPRPSAAPAKGWDPGDDVARATGKLVRIGQQSTSAAIWVAIIGVPILFSAAACLIVAWQLFRVGRWLARRNARLGAEA